MFVGPLALLVSGEAVASGSSHVEASSGAVRIAADTPSITFVEEGDERSFHTSWRDDAQPLVDAAAARAAAEVASWTKKERRLLCPWSADLRVAQSWADPSEAWSLEATPGPVSYSTPAGLVGAPPMTISMVELAFAEPPSRAVADALVARIVAAMVEPDEPTESAR